MYLQNVRLSDIIVFFSLEFTLKMVEGGLSETSVKFLPHVGL